MQAHSQPPLSPDDTLYLRRAITLAQMASSRVYPNPFVGAVIVHQGRIIGEGFHAYAGGPHAEVEAIRQVKDLELLSGATLYVTLEPCNFFGKTPPCVDLILRHRIPRVVVGCQDPNPKVSGGGLRRLREAGIEVAEAPDPGPFLDLIRVFRLNQTERRPWVTLKWAATADGFIGGWDDAGNPVPEIISCEASMALAHRLRAWHHAILVGRGTATADNPRLTTRLHPGLDPLRIVLDRHRQLDPGLHLFTDGNPTLCLTDHPEPAAEGPLRYHKPAQWQDFRLLFAELYQALGVCSIMVEGGAAIHQHLLDQGIWDELYRIQSVRTLGQGVREPRLPAGFSFDRVEPSGTDWLGYRRAQPVRIS